MIASWQPVKNHQGFMAAAAMLAKQRPDVHFVCAGRRVAFDNPEAAAVVPDAIRAQVHLLGERRDIAALNAAFDVAVNASHAEAFPNVVGEAMACGVPMVVTDVGDSAWILDGNGEVVPPGDAGALAQALTHLLMLRPAERQALGQRGRQRIVENFSLETVAERYLCEWSKLCASPV
jgi:glycosyltransferase involved in cell wall biosynthesis